MDLYKILGLSKDADGSEVKKAFKRRAKATHPDAGGSTEAFAEVKRAHVGMQAQNSRLNPYSTSGFGR
jgi:curved DNA-binding protein CbpA